MKRDWVVGDEVRICQTYKYPFYREQIGKVLDSSEDGSYLIEFSDGSRGWISPEDFKEVV